MVEWNRPSSSGVKHVVGNGLGKLRLSVKFDDWFAETLTGEEAPEILGSVGVTEVQLYAIKVWPAYIESR